MICDPLGDAPAEPGVEIFLVRRKQIQLFHAQARRLGFDRCDEARADAAAAVIFFDVERGQPRRQLGPRVHVVRHEADRADRLAVLDRHERQRDPVLVRALGDEPLADLDRVLGVEVAPLLVHPARKDRYQLFMVGEIIYFHFPFQIQLTKFTKIPRKSRKCFYHIDAVNKMRSPS